MARVKGGLGAKKRHNRTLKLAKGYRGLWIVRINAAARMNEISYSKLIHGLKVTGVNINRKMLAELAVSDPAAFTKLAETAKAAL